LKFGGHEYALITDEEVTWHVAKRICEEMGGHLVTLDNAEEEMAVRALCQKAGRSIWIGASDEEVEGQWRWVTGGSANELPKTVDNAPGTSHHLSFFPDNGSWNDTLGGSRMAFICEWDN